MSDSSPLRFSPEILLLPYQRVWVRDKTRFKIGLWARQTGKSFSCAAEAVLNCLARPGEEWIILSTGERQALEFMRKARLWAEALEFAVRQEFHRPLAPAATMKAAAISWANGSRMIALPANPQTARGYSANLILDEFAFHERPDEIWRAIYPSLTNPLRGPKKLRIVSTPNGKDGRFHDLWSLNSSYSKHRVTVHDARAQGLNLDLEALRAGLDDPEGWAQEYECQFIDSASVLLPYDLIASCESPEASHLLPPGFLHRTDPRRELCLGIDVGRRRDRTVGWMLERVGDVWWTREVLVLENQPFHLQMSALLERARAARAIAIDATGLGAMLAEELARHTGPDRVFACSFSAGFKLELFPALRRHFEERSLRIPATAEIREDLHGLQKITSNAGVIRYRATQTEDGHSDRATALALALHAARQASPEPVTAPRLVVRTEHQSRRRNGEITV